MRKFILGDRVSHPIFGKGTVTAYDDHNDNDIIVEFDNDLSFMVVNENLCTLISCGIYEQEPKWIPINERLPNLDDYSGSSVWKKKVLITGYLSFDDTKGLFVSEAFAEDVIYNNIHDTVVTAWMPLPKPYKEESEG